MEGNILLRKILILAIPLLLGACQSARVPDQRDFRKQLEPIQTTSNHQPAGTGKQLASHISENRFDLAAHNLNVKQFFLGLSKSSNYNIIMHPEVKGSISVNLKQTTVLEALKTIRDLYGYEFQIVRNNILVLGNRLNTRIFSINYLDFVRQGVSNTKVNATGLTSGGGQGSSSSSNNNKTEAASKKSGIGVQLQTSTKSGFWRELQLTLETIVGDKDGRKIIVSPSSGLVLVKAMPAELRIVDQFLSQAQGAINRQVILEAKILEIELNTGFQTGINWGQLVSTSHGQLVASQIGGGSLFKGSNVSEISGNPGNLDPSNPTNLRSGITSAFGGIFTLSLRGGHFQTFIELLQTQGNVNVLSSPRVATLNNQKAVIKVGGDEFFVTGITNNNTIQGNSTIPSPSVELTPFFSGISLDVTPQISNQEEIILHVHPTISSVTQRNKSFIVSGENFSLPLAFNTIQESDNVVKARSGQFIIIGGLIKTSKVEQTAKIPLLGSIPILGRLFQHNKLVNSKRELVILIRPTVVDGNFDWNEQIGDNSIP